MGSEANCSVKLGKRRVQGKALLETSELVFRGAEDGFRLKIAFKNIRSAKAVDGELGLQTADGLVVFELGAAAEKWCAKILHPKTRLEKLGAKVGCSVSLMGTFDAGFLRELKDGTKNIHDGKVDASSEIIFASADSAKDLGPISKIAKAMRGATALWVVYPKGKKEITESQVLAAGREARLKDVKVVGFSLTHTALKFVIPVERR